MLIPTLDQSGAEKQLTLLAEQLPHDEFEVRVVALTRGGPYAKRLAESGIHVTVLHKRFRFDPLAYWHVRRLIAQWRPDVLHTWLFAANAYGRLAAGPHAPFPIIVSERCVDSWKSGWQHWLDRRLAPRTARLVGNSCSVLEYYAEQGFPRERLAVIYNGIDAGISAAFDRDARLAELGLPPEARVVGYVGRLARQKRVADLIWALELIRILQDEVYLVIVGDGPERSRLEQFARDIQIERRVRFLGHREDAVRLFPLMNVFWLASDFEGLSNSLMEAQAAGIPAVVSNIGPNRELVISGETGYVVPVGDRVAFAQYTERLLTDTALAEQMGRAARLRMSQEFGVRRMVEAYAALYREVVKSRPN